MSERAGSRPDRRHSEEIARRWAAELLARFRSADGAAQREQVLRELDRPLLLDEDSALELYRLQPDLASGFIRRHAPRGRRADDARLPWAAPDARGAGTRRRRAALRPVPCAGPARAVGARHLELARRVANPERLCEELERRHPQRWRADVGPHLHALAQLRGEHMLSYLEGHATEVWSARRRAGRAEMAELARRRGWWELWAQLTVCCTSAAEYDAEVMTLVQDQASPEAQVRQQLLQLAGAPAAAERSERHRQAAQGCDAAGALPALPALCARTVSRTARTLGQAASHRPARARRRAARRRAHRSARQPPGAYQPRSGDTALIDAAQLAANYYAGARAR